MLQKILEISKITESSIVKNVTKLLEEQKKPLSELFNILLVLDELKLDQSCFLAEILNYVFEDNSFDVKTYIKNNFPDDATELFINLKQLEKYSAKNISEAENFRMMLIAISKDIRVIIIKLCLILFSLRNLTPPITPVFHAYLTEVREIFAPLAERFGLYLIKSELEDLCLKFLEPDVYEYLLSNLMLKKEENEKQIELTKSRIENILQELKINAIITHRQKHFSSIYRKMTTNKLPLAKIYDLVAIRIIAQTVEDCYAIMGSIHGIYKPMPTRLKDFIANPKPNGYQSLHTTIIAENNRPLEIQIRTQEMHRVADYGIAAHWIYKEKRIKKTTLDEKLKWIRSIMENAESLSNRELIDAFKEQLSSGVIYAQTPKGKIIEFPEGATLIDFAYAIHSDIGNSCVGGKVNGILKPLTTELNNGDIIEILTSQNSKGPSRDWLKHVLTSSAKSKIKNFFRKEFKEEYIKTGKRMIEEELKSRSLEASKLLSSDVFTYVYEKLCFNEPDELFASVGYGSTSIRQVVNRLINENLKSQIENNHPKDLILSPPKLLIKKNKDGILIDGESGMLIRYAGCCGPVMGDSIIGYISRGKGVTIHRENCHNLKFFEKERLIAAEWMDKVSGQSQTFVAGIRVISIPSNKFLQLIMKQIIEMKIFIISFQSKKVDDYSVTHFKLQVETLEQLAKVIKMIEGYKETKEVNRINE